MKKIFLNIFNTTTFRQSSVTSIGTIINGILGALFYIVVARLLGPSEFGLLTIAITTLTLIGDIADIGTNTGLIRFVSHNLTQDKERAFKFLKLSLEVKFFVWVVTMISLFFLAPVLAIQIFHKAELLIPLRMVSIGVGGALLFSFATSSLQAFQKYFLWSVINIFTNSLRLLLIIALSLFIKIDISNSLLTYITLPFFGFFIALLILPTRKMLSVKNETQFLRELFSYNVPVAIFTFIAAISSRLDTFISASLLSSKDIGIYGAANQLVQAVPQLISAIGVVAAPKFASFDTKEKMIAYFKKFQLFVSALVLVGILIIPILIILIPHILGQDYLATIIPFIILFISGMVFLFSLPVHNGVIFYFSRPDVFIWVSLGNLFIIAGLGYYMILNYGVVGAAVTVLIGNLFNFLAPLIWFINKVKKSGNG